MSNMVKAQQRIEKRVRMSEPLLKSVGMSVAHYQRVTLNALIRTPKLAECSGQSLEKAVVECIELGLMPDGREAVIVPFGRDATLIPMIAGRIRLARQATKGLALRARCVYRGDHWKHEEGLIPIMEHRKTEDSSADQKDIIAAYAIGRIPGSAESDWEVLYRSEIERYRARSRASNGPAWTKDWGEQAEKTVLGLLLKRYPWKSEVMASLADAPDGWVDVQNDDAEVLPDEPPPEPEQRGEAQVVEAAPVKEVILAEVDASGIARQVPGAKEKLADAMRGYPEPPPQKPKPRRAKQARRAAPKPAPEPPPEPGYDAHGLPEDADGAPF